MGLRAELERLKLEIEDERRRHAKELTRLSSKLTEIAAQAEPSDDSEDDDSGSKKSKPKSIVHKSDSDAEEEAQKKIDEKKKEEERKKEEEKKKIEPGSVDDPNFTEFEREALRAHNEYRAKHRAPPMKLTRELCNFATEWSKHLANINTLQHRTPHTGKGENLWGGFGSGLHVDGRTAVKAWYDEVKYYSYGSGFAMNTGHFTQVVWKDSLEMGIGMARNNRGGVFIAANYYPAGNFQGKFRENVLPPQ